MRIRAIIILIVTIIGILAIGTWAYFHYQNQVTQTEKLPQTEAFPSPLQKATPTSDLENVPEVPGSSLKYKIIGAKSAVFLVEVRYENSYYDYDYNVDMDAKLEGLLHLEPPPERENCRIYITALSETGRSEPLVFTNKEWWGKVRSSGKEFAMEYNFRIQ